MLGRWGRWSRWLMQSIVSEALASNELHEDNVPKSASKNLWSLLVHEMCYVYIYISI